MQPHRVHIPADPPAVTTSVLVNKVIAFTPMPEPSVPFAIDVGTIMSQISGGTTYWSRVRIEKIQIWGLPDSVLEVQVPTDNGWDQPPIEWEDTGVPGQSRPRIAFKLGLLDRTRWFSPTSEQILFRAIVTPDAGLVIHASVALMSPFTN